MVVLVMRFLFSFALFVFLYAPFSVLADENAAAKSVISGNEILLEDGRLLHLKNIKAVASESKTFLESVVLGRTLVLKDATDDRYRRVTATVFVQGQTESIEELLLRKGLAFVYPHRDNAFLDAYAQIERQARLSRQGLWATFNPVSAEEAATLIGKYGFVSGTVLKAERIKNKVFLSFGTQERVDFTVIVAARYLRALKKRGLDLFLSEGKSVLARGWVSKDAAPSIIMSNSYQLEEAE